VFIYWNIKNYVYTLVIITKTSIKRNSVMYNDFYFKHFSEVIGYTELINVAIIIVSFIYCNKYIWYTNAYWFFSDEETETKSVR